MKNSIKWTCQQCHKANEWEMHEPDAHFVSMVCDHCGDEIDGCLCDAIPTFRSLGKKGGEATKKKYGAEHFRKMQEKRWPKKGD